jgi:hypothetical protein
LPPTTSPTSTPCANIFSLLGFLLVLEDTLPCDMSNNYDAHLGAEVLPSRAHDMSDDHEAISATLEAPFPVQNQLLPSPSSPLNASHVSSPLEPDIPKTGSASVDCATAPDPSHIPADALKEGGIHNQGNNAQSHLPNMNCRWLHLAQVIQTRY